MFKFAVRLCLFLIAGLLLDLPSPAHARVVRSWALKHNNGKPEWTPAKLSEGEPRGIYLVEFDSKDGTSVVMFAGQCGGNCEARIEVYSYDATKPEGKGKRVWEGGVQGFQADSRRSMPISIDTIDLNSLYNGKNGVLSEQKCVIHTVIRVDGRVRDGADAVGAVGCRR
jgi:hypothetical protein